MIGRWDLSFEEWNALLHLHRAEDAVLSKETERRLRDLGLTEGGNVVTAAGRALIEHELLMDRRNRLQR